MSRILLAALVFAGCAPSTSSSLRTGQDAMPGIDSQAGQPDCLVQPDAQVPLPDAAIPDGPPLPPTQALISATFDGSDNLIVLGAELRKIDANNNVVWTIPIVDGLDVKTGPLDTIYLYTKTAVTKYDSDGTHLWTRNITSLNNPLPFANSLAVDQLGNVVVRRTSPEQWHELVTRWDASGTMVWEKDLRIATGYNLSGIVIDQEGTSRVLYGGSSAGFGADAENEMLAIHVSATGIVEGDDEFGARLRTGCSNPNFFRGLIFNRTANGALAGDLRCAEGQYREFRGPRGEVVDDQYYLNLTLSGVEPVPYFDNDSRRPGLSYHVGAAYAGSSVVGWLRPTLTDSWILQVFTVAGQLRATIDLTSVRPMQIAGSPTGRIAVVGEQNGQGWIRQVAAPTP